MTTSTNGKELLLEALEMNNSIMVKVREALDLTDIDDDTYGNHIVALGIALSDTFEVLYKIDASMVRHYEKKETTNE